jgi:O-antigen ligase|tara:strand:- start:620 stop:1984 length:1365 start_codon:yes stop_codon:yes gene_type:complete
MNKLAPLILLVGIELVVFFAGIVLHPALMVGIPIGMILLWWMLNHPGMSVVLLMFTGVVKGYILAVFPMTSAVDITIILVLITWAGLAKRLLEGSFAIDKELYTVFWLFTLFALFVLFSAFYTPSPHYGWLKAARFSLITFTMFLAPLVFLKTQEDSSFLTKSFNVFIATMTVLFIGKLIYVVITGGLLGYLVRITFTGINPIGPARVMSIGAGIALVYMFHLRNQINWKYGLIVFVMILGTITTGSRGPLLSFFIGGSLYLLLFEPFHRRRLLLYTGVGISIIIVLLLLLPENLTYRFLNISTGDYVMTQTGIKRYSTVASRLDFWTMSLNAWISSIKNFFFGLGSGGFSSLFIWRDFRWYPHNFIFEIIVEFGLVGFLLLSSFLMKSWFFIWKEQSWSRESRIWIVSALIMFFAALISGDINDNRILWTLISLSVASISVKDNHYYNVPTSS